MSLSRLRQVTKYTGTVVCGLILLVWTLSWFWQASFVRGNGFEQSMTRLDAGAVIRFTWGPYPNQISPPDRSFTLRREHSRMSDARWWPGHSKTSPVASLTWIPLWLPFLLLALPTALLFYLDRRPRSGLCPSCRYDLSGVPPGPCPECGRPAADDPSSPIVP